MVSHELPLAGYDLRHPRQQGNDFHRLATALDARLPQRPGPGQTALQYLPPQTLTVIRYELREPTR